MQGEIGRSNLTPPQSQEIPHQPGGAQASLYLTREDIATILLKARKAESSVYIDTRPSYPEEVAKKPYPANFTSLIFLKYDGVAGNAKEHIQRYVDSLTAHFHDHELRLKEFSKCWKAMPSRSILVLHQVQLLVEMI